MRGLQQGIVVGLPAAGPSGNLGRRVPIIPGQPRVLIPIPSLRASADRLLDVLLDLLGAGNAIDLRIARIAAWIKCQDPAGCGYVSHSAIFREHIGWGDSWLRQLVRLVESDLSLIQAAVCVGKLPLSVAVRAPGLVEPSEQSAWLQCALDGDLHLLPRPPRRQLAARPGIVRTVQLDEAEMADIHQVRQLARLAAGKPLSDACADRFVLDCWRRGVNGPQHGHRRAAARGEAGGSVRAPLGGVGSLGPVPARHRTGSVGGRRGARGCDKYWRPRPGLRQPGCGLRAGLGWALVQQGRTDDACRAFDAVLAVAPEHGAAVEGAAAVDALAETWPR